MKKYLLIFLALVILPLGLMGCEEDTTSPTAPAVPSIDKRLTEAEAGVVALSGQLAAKAETATVTAIANRVAALEGQSSANTYTKAQLYTKAEVDAAVAAAVAALKADQAWIEGRTTTTGAGTTVGDYGELIDEDGDLQLWLEEVGGDASDELRTRDGTNEARFDFIVVNLDDSSHDFKIDLEFEPEDGKTTLNIDLAVASTKAVASGNLDYKAATRSPQPNADSILRFGQDNQGRILKGDVEDFTVWITVEQTAGGVTDWEYDIRIKDKD